MTEVWVAHITIAGLAGVYSTRERAERVVRDVLDAWWPDEDYIQKVDDNGTLFFFDMPYGQHADATVLRRVLDAEPATIKLRELGF